MLIEIKNRWNSNIIIAGEYESIKDALLKNRGADLRGADLRGADLRGADLRDAYLCGADLRGADLCDADLRDAKLCDADLCDADLRDANLRGANLCGANLCDANLRDAWLYGSHIPGLLSIQGSSWPLFAYQDYIRIGCERWPVEHWLENYQVIGEKHNYTQEQIAEYKAYIDTCATFLKSS